MVCREIQLALDADAFTAGRHAGELDALGGIHLAAIQMPQEIEVPPGAAEFAVGRKLQAHRRLPVDDLLDLGILDLAQLIGLDRALLEFRARVLDAVGTQQAADLVGTERRFGT